MGTKIAWCDEVWNVVVGCSKVSAGCQNCFAERMAVRLAGMGQQNYQAVLTPTDDGATHKWNGKTVFVESALGKPLHWRKPRTIFVVSMGDLFHETVPFEWIDEVMMRITLSQQHTYMLLTKRPQRMQEYFRRFYAETAVYRSIHIGVTVENQKAADERILPLLKTPAAKRFISFEPLLEKIDSPTIDSTGPTGSKRLLEDINYAFIGCESGPGARLCTQDDIRSVRDQLQESGVKVGIKQIPIKGKCSKFENRDSWPEDLRVWEIEHE